MGGCTITGAQEGLSVMKGCLAQAVQQLQLLYLATYLCKTADGRGVLCAAALLWLSQVRAAEMPLGSTGAHSWHVLRGFKHSAGGWWLLLGVCCGRSQAGSVGCADAFSLCKELCQVTFV